MKQGVLKLELCGREISEMRFLIIGALNKTKPNNQVNKMLIAYYKRILFKLSGSYQCKHCKQWVMKGE
jgi:hypothetical protein